MDQYRVISTARPSPRKWHQLSRAEREAIDMAHRANETRQYVDDLVRPAPTETSFGRAATRRRAQAARRAAKLGVTG